MQLERFPEEAELEGAYAEAASEDYLEEEAGGRPAGDRPRDPRSHRAPRRLERIRALLAPGGVVALMLPDSGKRAGVAGRLRGADFRDRMLVVAAPGQAGTPGPRSVSTERSGGSIACSGGEG